MVEVIREQQLDLFPRSGENPDVSPFDRIKRTREDGTEYWSARELMPLLGYARFENLEVPIKRAMATANNQAHDVETLFLRSQEKTSGRPRTDYQLVRYAAYLVAMNGDPNMPEVAAAQSYFAISTREAETQPARELTFEEMTLQVMQGLTRQVEDQRRELAIAAPKADAWDDFLAKGGDYDRRAAASILSRRQSINLGQNKLTDLLIEWGWIGKDRKPKYPYTAREYFASRPYSEPVLNEKTGEHFTPDPQLRITANGIDAIARKIQRTNLQIEGSS